MYKHSNYKPLKQLRDKPTDRWTDGRMGGLTDRWTKKRSMNDIKTFKNIQNVFKLGETLFKQVIDRWTDIPMDQLTYQKLALRGLSMPLKHSKTF